ncbi:hypothetical protein DFAR_3180028 [Desulfarculales bacterium]
MRVNPTLDKLHVLGLEDMLKALKEQLGTPEAQELGFGERLGRIGGRGGHSQKKLSAQKQAGQGQAPA